MAKAAGVIQRVFVKDRRRPSDGLRLTWHPEEQAFVLSIWRDNVCIATTWIDASEAEALRDVLAAGSSEE